MTLRILIIDDDPELRSLLTRYLEKQNFQVQTLPDARDLDRRLQRDRPHLLVLDLMLPGEDGLAICRRLRAAGETVPIIMLTARSEDVDRIVGLEMGADDYLGKPFNPRELVARIAAVMRRCGDRVPGAPMAGGVSRFGPWTLDMGARSLTKAYEPPINLSTGEFALLSVFVSYPNQPLSRDRLMELGRSRELDAYDRTIDVQVHRLRRIIEDDPRQPKFIQTVWGHGYVFVPGPTEA